MAAEAGRRGRRGLRDGPPQRARDRDGAARPPFLLALLPLALVLVANFVLSRTSWSVATWYPAETLKADFPSASLAASAPTWALIVALVLGIAATLAIQARRVKDRLAPALSAATTGALLAIFNTASEVGFGNTIKTLPGFRAIQDGVFLVSRHVLVSEARPSTSWPGSPGRPRAASRSRSR